MEPSKKPRTPKTDVIGLAFTVLLACASFYWAVGGGLARISALGEEQKDLTGQLSYVTELTNVLQEGEEALQSVEAWMEELRERLPPQMDFSGFYELLTERAAQSNVLVSEVEPQGMTIEEECVEMPVSVSAIGSFEDFHRFLFALVNAPRLIKMSSLSVSPEKSPRLCRIDMVVSIYSTRQEEERRGS
ncbi:MAG TPA: type 4a pilus biogenesis protein PilO [Sumerlaeia bacterium]|nr:type 4a pilus biogenesis protein PilO [Sumerlaeia bacterium]